MVTATRVSGVPSLFATQSERTPPTQTMKVIQATKSILVASLALTLGACSGRIALKPSDRASIHSVSLQQQISKPKTMFYMDLTTGTGVALGGIVGAVVAASSVPSGERLQRQAESSGIAVENIARDAFTHELQRSGALPLAHGGSGDATFKVSVTLYGVTYIGLTRSLTPLVSMLVQLVQPDGKVIYSNYNLGQASPSMRHTFEEFYANPQLLRAGWEDAAHNAAQKLIAELRR